MLRVSTPSVRRFLPLLAHPDEGVGVSCAQAGNCSHEDCHSSHGVRSKCAVVSRVNSYAAVCVGARLNACTRAGPHLPLVSSLPPTAMPLGTPEYRASHNGTSIYSTLAGPGSERRPLSSAKHYTASRHSIQLPLGLFPPSAKIPRCPGNGLLQSSILHTGQYTRQELTTGLENGAI